MTELSDQIVLEQLGGRGTPDNVTMTDKSDRFAVTCENPQSLGEGVASTDLSAEQARALADWIYARLAVRGL